MCCMSLIWVFYSISMSPCLGCCQRHTVIFSFTLKTPYLAIAPMCLNITYTDQARDWNSPHALQPSSHTSWRTTLTSPTCPNRTQKSIFFYHLPLLLRYTLSSLDSSTLHLFRIPITFTHLSALNISSTWIKHRTVPVLIRQKGDTC